MSVGRSPAPAEGPRGQPIGVCHGGWELCHAAVGSQGLITGVPSPLDSYTTDNITQMWYPSFGYLGRKGIVTGAYNYDDDARLMARST